MARRIEVALKPDFEDATANNILQRLISDFSLTGLIMVRRVNVYTFENEILPPDAHKFAQDVFSDPLNQQYCIDSPIDKSFSAGIEIGFRPGVKDNVGETAKIACEDVLSKPIEGKIYTSMLYLFYGDFPLEIAQRIASDVLCNPLIEQWRTIEPVGVENFYASSYIPKAGEDSRGMVSQISLPDNNRELEKISKHRLLSLSTEEMHQIRKYYLRPKTIRDRKKEGLPNMPTDVELECIAQTWSEHCKHKIFNAQITYTEPAASKKEKKKEIKIDSLFKTYISGTTKKILPAQKYLLSVFSDNAGVMAIDTEWALALKVETHNSPSALDPFGGALTGILGVNRDILGTGLGAKPIFNTDIFCFAPPDYKGQIPPKLHHPKRVFQGVRAGVEKGGNASGIPTVNGSIVFDNRYLGKPLVYCGTGGLMPRKLSNGRLSHKKTIKPRDRIFMVGGKVGKDGIHGATFSSAELNESSPTSAVQLGDPFTQKIMIDFLLESRDKGLHSGLTDDGAGGLSSSIGELATLTGGAIVHLERCPLKYPGLDPWEIFVSESQERMTLAVPLQKAGEFVVLAKQHGVEATDIGEFTNSGFLRVEYHSKPVLHLELEFLHNGLPRMKLNAVHRQVHSQKETLTFPSDLKSELLSLLARPNICSKENTIRRYDHEVQGMSVIKPLCGVEADGPSDAACLQPFPHKHLAIIVSHGICPKFSDYDCYNMAQLAVDEAVRNYIATGGDPTCWGALDNFCWPDPIKSAGNKDGEYKLAQLVRANMGLADICKAYSLPLISGKDSMKNDYSHSGIKISVPPTLLISLCGVSKDARRSISTDFKQSGDLIYVLGKTFDELAGSEYYLMHSAQGSSVPKVLPADNLHLYKKLHEAIREDLVQSAHDCSDGGIGVALAESAIGGKLGAHIHISNILREDGLRDDKSLFSESAGRFIVTIRPDCKSHFEKIMHGSVFSKIGEVISGSEFIISGTQDSSNIKTDVSELEAAFKSTLNF
ncbi:MAG: AIR synthase-related protein [Candidatus Micrarchaeia archaeon]